MRALHHFQLTCTEAGAGMQLNGYVKLAVALGILGLLGIVVAALLLGTGLPEESHACRVGDWRLLAPRRFARSRAADRRAFYAEMAAVNLRMHERHGDRCRAATPTATLHA